MTKAQASQDLATQFEDTTVKVTDLTAYLFQLPRYLEAGVYAGVEQQALDYLAYTDGVDFWLRRYLTGHPKTLHRLFHEIRMFIAQDEKVARSMTDLVLKIVENAILSGEWYEIMPRYQKARRRIQKTFGI